MNEAPEIWRAGSQTLIEEPCPVILTQGPAAALCAEIEKVQPSSVFVLADENTVQHCYTIIKDNLPAHQLIGIPAGEQAKSLSTCEEVWRMLGLHHADRHSLLVNLGGGMVGDLGGFAAAVYKRGIPFIQVPTSLLAMVDASAGGKTGIDFAGFKNQIGAFADAAAVIVSPRFLHSLPQRELLSGFAEVIKHCLLGAPHKIVSLAAEKSLPHDWTPWIESSIAFKAAVVNEDPRERGKRKLLNLGHTIGHALESWSLQQHGAAAWLHGECVAAGLLCEAHLAWKRSRMKEEEWLLLAGLILDFFPKLNVEAEAIPRIVEFARQDKKNHHGAVKAVLLQGLGPADWDVEISLDEIAASLHHYSALRWN